MLATTTFNSFNRPALPKVTRHFDQFEIVHAKPTQQMLNQSLGVIVVFVLHGSSPSTVVWFSGPMRLEMFVVSLPDTYTVS